MRANQDIKTLTSIKEVLSSLRTMEDSLYTHGPGQHDYDKLDLFIDAGIKKVPMVLGRILCAVYSMDAEMESLLFHVCPGFTPFAPPAPPPRPPSDDVELQRLNFYFMTMFIVVIVCVMVYIPGCWAYRAWRERDETESQVHEPVLEPVSVVADTARREEEAAQQQEALLDAFLLQQDAEPEVPEAAESDQAASECDTAEARLEAAALEDIARMSPDPAMHASMSTFLVAFAKIHSELCACIEEIAGTEDITDAEDITQRLGSVENVCNALMEDSEHACVAQILRCELGLVADTRQRMQWKEDVADFTVRIQREIDADSNNREG
jgi:hypothetical protein